MSFFRRLTIERLAEAILFILLFIMAVGVPLDTDVWWHLEAGASFWETGEILQTDIFSHSLHGEKWINHSWGAQALLAGVYQLAGGSGDDVSDSGVLGLALYTAILATGGMVLVYRMCQGTVYSKAFVLVLGAATAAVFWSPRPQMVSFFLSAVVLYILHRYKYEGEKRVIWLIPFIMVLWVNLHAGFAIGFIYLGLFIAGEVATQLFDTERAELAWREIGQVILISCLSLAALALNPYGIRMILYPFETAGLQTLNLFIAEWLSPNFKNPQTWAFLMMLFSLFTLAGLTQKRLAWGEIAFIVGTGVLALFAARNIAVFAVATTPILSSLVDEWLRERGLKLTPMRKISGAKAAVNWVLLSVILLGGLAKIANDLNPNNVKKVQGEYLPLAAIDYLNANPPTGNLWNNYNWGGLVIFATDIPVFVDGRTDLYGDKFLSKYFRASLGASDWRETFAAYDIQAAFLENETALTTLLREDENWELVYEDDQATIFIKAHNPSD